MAMRWDGLIDFRNVRFLDPRNRPIFLNIAPGISIFQDIEKIIQWQIRIEDRRISLDSRHNVTMLRVYLRVYRFLDEVTTENYDLVLFYNEAEEKEKEKEKEEEKEETKKEKEEKEEEEVCFVVDSIDHLAEWDDRIPSKNNVVVREG
ncbi:hypothetical protein V1478_009903 [Vespula squamosa]|uniref:Uncharacterized protein n=1 Tax=Vespula squamosa TaxID=30214 RepID=A0ABD2AJR0_VESSQ